MEAIPAGFSLSPKSIPGSGILCVISKTA